MTNRLHQHMAHMVSSEASMGLILNQIRDVVSGHEDMSAFVDNCIELTKTQRQAIESRLHEVAERVVLPDMSESLWALHEFVESSQTGAAMKFRVRHQSGENTLVSVVRVS